MEIEEKKIQLKNWLLEYCRNDYHYEKRVKKLLNNDK